jgi:hypothetical protein
MRMKMLFATAVVLFSLTAGGSALAQSPSRPPTAAAPLSFKVLADRMTSMFPAVTTDVVEVAGTKVTLAAGRSDGLQPGVELTLFREGREIYHPTTKKLLGRTEETIGRVSVTDVLENYSVGTIVDGSGARAGDRARVSAGKAPLTVVPLTTGPRAPVVEAATYELIQELERTGRFQILLGDAVGVWMNQERIAAPEFARGNGVATAAQRFKIANLLVLHFTTVENKPFMDARLFSGTFAAPLVSTAFFVPPSVKPRTDQAFSGSQSGQGNVRVEQRSLLARLLSGNFEPNAYSASAASIPLRSLATLPFTVISMDVAVSPSDKMPRIVVTEGNRVFLYRLNNLTLEPEWTYDRRSVGSILTVQFADLNADGVLDVVVNRQDAKAGMLSYILTTEAGRPSLIVNDVPMMMLAVDENGDGVNRTLFTQKYNDQTFWTKGAVTRYVLKDRDVTPAGTVRVDDTFRVTGAAFSNIGGKELRVLAFVDEGQRLKLVAGGQEVWRSQTTVGGGLAQARLQIPMLQTFVDKYFKMEPNPVPVDLDADGTQEIVVPINEDEAGRMAVVFKGPVGYRVQVVSSGFEGMVTGLGAIPGDGSPSLIAAVVKRSGLLFKTGGDTQLIMTVSE